MFYVLNLDLLNWFTTEKKQFLNANFYNLIQNHVKRGLDEDLKTVLFSAIR